MFWAIIEHETAMELRIEDGQETRDLEYAGDRQLTIGRASDCDIVLCAGKVSRHHASIVPEEGKFLLVDAGSTNGTRLNNIKADRAQLEVGDIIQIGDARIIFGAPAQASTPPSPAPLPKAAPVEPRPALARLLAPRLILILLFFLLPVPAFFLWKIGADGTKGVPSKPVVSQEEAKQMLPASTVTPAPPALPDIVPAPEPAPVLEAISEAKEAPKPLEISPNAPSAERTSQEASSMEAARRDIEKNSKDAAEKLLQKRISEERYAEAAAALNFLKQAALDQESKAFWESQAARIEEILAERFQKVEEELSKLTSAGKTSEALLELIKVQSQFGGSRLYESLLPRYAAASLDSRKAFEQPIDTARTLELKDRAAAAFEDCRFNDLALLHHLLLVASASAEEKALQIEAQVESLYMARMFEEFVTGLSEKPVEVSVVEGYPGRVTRADPRDVEYELDINGRTAAYRDKRPWNRVSRPKKSALFDSAPLGREGLLGLAFFGFRIGNEEGAQAALLRLHKRKDSEGVADAVLARRLGTPVPDGGFVEFEGRLVTPEAKAAEVARRKEGQEKEKKAKDELARLKKDTRLESYVELAKHYRSEGFFKLAQLILIQVGHYAPQTSAGKEAKRLVDDPVLAIHSLLENGPPENRLDIYILGEGYPVQDDYQTAFLAQANTAMKLLIKEDPYKEYASYFNFFAAQLGSKDRGLDHQPGNVQRDTALDGKVEWDRFTVSSGKVMAVLKRIAKGHSDGLAIVIGNDTAGVSTGGGGVACACKASLDSLPHELGHALGGLRDEYDFEPGTDPNRHIAKGREANVPVKELRPNLMAGSSKDEVLERAYWKYWMDAGPTAWWNGSKVSAFEGANETPFNVWRPQASCKMRSVGTNFCVVCMEVMVKKIYRFVRPIDRVEPAGPELALEEGRGAEVRVWPMKPETHFLEATWYLQELPDKEEKGPTIVVPGKPEVLKTTYRRFDPEGRVVEVALLRAKELKRKRYKLRVEVRDPTPWVLKDDEHLLTQSREWTIRTAAR